MSKVTEGNSGEGGDDLYSGYQSVSLERQPAQAAAAPFNQPQQRIGSSWGAASDEPQRPMTAIKAAGYTTGRQKFDPLSQSSGNFGAHTLRQKPPPSAEDVALEMEDEVNTLVEASAASMVEADPRSALEKAKAAAKKERQLLRHREQHNISDALNVELMYCVYFCLACAQEGSGMLQEALNSYGALVRNKQYSQAGQLRVNMGNIYYRQGKFSNAIKMYRMALDQIPNGNKEVRSRINRNIGNVLMKMKQYREAAEAFEDIMQDRCADFQTAYNLIICYFALGERKMMKDSFVRLLDLDVLGAEQSNEADVDEDEDNTVDDQLSKELESRRKKARGYILAAAKLIAPVVERDLAVGYNFVAESLKATDYPDLGSQMEMAKAIMFLKRKDFRKAIETLKDFEKKDQPGKDKIYNNLSFVYFLENDVKNAEKYADLAVNHDRFNQYAIVNKGNCYMFQGEVQKAKDLYLEAVRIDGECIEALYNLGLACSKLKMHREALHAFEKIHSIMPNHSEVIYNIADTYDKTRETRAAIKWFNILISRSPTDSRALARLGSIFGREGDESQAFHFYYESFRYCPVDLDVISWLGAYFVKNEMYERAVHFFERAANLQPDEVKWKLMVGSCYRRTGAYQQAIKTYEEIQNKFPGNSESLKYLVQLSQELGMDEDALRYQQELSRAEKADRAPAVSRPAVGEPSNQFPDVVPEAAPMPAAAIPQESPVAPKRESPLDSPFASQQDLGASKGEEDIWQDEEIGDDLMPMA